MTRGARQSRNHRRRERLGLVVLQIEVPEVELLETLRVSGWIPEGAASRPLPATERTCHGQRFDRLVVTRSDHRDEETTGGLVVSELPIW